MAEGLFVTPLLLPRVEHNFQPLFDVEGTFDHLFQRIRVDLNGSVWLLEQLTNRRPELAEDASNRRARLRNAAWAESLDRIRHRAAGATVRRINTLHGLVVV